MSYFSRTQTRVAASSTEGDYVALGYVVKEAEFVRGVLKFLEPHHARRVVVNENNIVAIRLATNPECA